VTARVGGAALRSSMRARRRKLSLQWRLEANVAILRQVRRLSEFRAARRIALFFAFDGEPDLAPLIRFDGRKRFFAPVISRDEMAFALLERRTALEPNFYGIPEPNPARLVDARSLDLVLTPLVAFDGEGTRLGVGAGYYDRCFAFLRQRNRWLKPKLIGVAYSLQEVENIERMPWDIPLSGVVTELGYRRFQRS